MENQLLLNAELSAIIDKLNTSTKKYRVGAIVYSKNKIKIKLARS